MRLSTACLIGCIGLFLAGLACLFIGVNPGFLRQLADPEGGGIENRSPPSPREVQASPENPAGEPAETEPPVKEGGKSIARP
jgi:hypothetical protein